MSHQTQIHATLSGVIQRFTSVVVVPILIPIEVNPPDIVTIKDDEFRIGMNNMKPGKPYLMKFRGSTYVILKNEDDALVIEEVDV